MKRVHSIRDLGEGFSEIHNNHPEHPLELLAKAVKAARRLNAKSIELEEEFNGQKRRYVIPI